MHCTRAFLIATCLLLGGCGLADTAATGAAGAASAAQQAQDGKRLENKVQRDLEAAQRQADAARATADAGDKAP